MTTVDFITALFCRLDDVLWDVATHPQAHLSPSEVVDCMLVEPTFSMFALVCHAKNATHRA